MSKKPDNVAWDEEKQKWVANILPYASNVGAPVIRPDKVDDWKLRGVNKVNKQFETKFLELKTEYQKLVEEYQWNELVYQSKFAYEPVIGEIYYLYVGNDGNPFLSLIAPNEWDKEHIGSFKLNSEQKWIKV
jgi:hypothetical protein